MKVYVENNDSLVIQMFQARGWEVLGAPEGADFICFTGGHDVDPSLYGEGRNPTVFLNIERDQACIELFEYAVENNIKMLGICRGAQFLCVANGGKLYQNVSNHTSTHRMLDIPSNQMVTVTSTHHQMMDTRSAEEGHFELVGMSVHNNTRKEHATREDFEYGGTDEEVNWCPSTQSLMFQPHPEYGLGECEAYFFELIERYFG